VTPSTLFYAGSTTKAFTAAIMSFLVDDNEKYPHLQWDTPINTLIRDDFVLSDEYATTHITVEDALSHRSGLPGHDSSLGGPGATVKSIVRDLRHLPMSAEPRTKYQYSNAMFIVASHVIQTVTGRQLGDLLRDWIWGPLGMDSTFFDLSSAKSSKEHLATGYRWLYHEEDGGFEDVGWMELDEISGAGSIITNVLDYAKWARAIFTKTTPLSKSGFEQWVTPRTLIPANEPFTGFKAYALGWTMGVYKGERFYEHSGGLKGFGAELIIFPDREFAVVCLANTGGTANFVDTRLAFHLIDEKLGMEKEQRFDFDKGYVSLLPSLPKWPFNVAHSEV
jgi:CubicO group peptidase (beta-lactamase class C family)